MHRLKTVRSRDVIYYILFAMCAMSMTHTRHADGFMKWFSPEEGSEVFGTNCRRLAKFEHILAVFGHLDIPVALPLLVNERNISTSGAGKNCLLSILVAIAQQRFCNVLQAAEEMIGHIQEGEVKGCSLPKFSHAHVSTCYSLFDMEAPVSLVSKVHHMEELFAGSIDNTDSKMEHDPEDRM